MLCRTSWFRRKLWNATWVWKSIFWGPTWIFFSPKISAKSVANTVKDFTKNFRLWKSRTKASGPEVCWHTIGGHWRGMYMKTNTGESHTPLHFRGKFVPVLLVRKVLFGTIRVLCVFEALPDRNILYTYLNSAYKLLLSSPIEVCGPKKKVKFCCPGHSIISSLYNEDPKIRRMIHSHTNWFCYYHSIFQWWTENFYLQKPWY